MKDKTLTDVLDKDSKAVLRAVLKSNFKEAKERTFYLKFLKEIGKK